MSERDDRSVSSTASEAQPSYTSTAATSTEEPSRRRKVRSTPNYGDYNPASERASTAARGASKKKDTKPELLLRKALWRVGLRYRKNVKTLPGKPDIVFSRARLVVFVDGDFWHGRHWPLRKSKLLKGSNPDYWIRKIERNMERDTEHVAKLKEMGWSIMRVWETDITSDLAQILDDIRSEVISRSDAPSLNTNEPRTDN
jgi:DNA mismatch endonuclease (patch repair protein)